MKIPHKPIDRVVRTPSEVESILERHPALSRELFGKGFLVSTRMFDPAGYPFRGAWTYRSFRAPEQARTVHLYVHPQLAFHEYRGAGRTLILLGHAYDPFCNEGSEEKLLAQVDEAMTAGMGPFETAVGGLSGVFVLLVVESGSLIAVQDAIGLKSLNYGRVRDDFVITSHAQLAGDLFDLPRDARVEKLASSRAYNIARRQLPGNITAFDAIRRLGGNFSLTLTDEFAEKRLFPSNQVAPVASRHEEDELLQQVADIMHTSLKLIGSKWQRPAISLSGGTDSRTTLACAAGLYPRFRFYSFHAKDQEYVDAMAARELCNKIGVQHTVYPIPAENTGVKNYLAMKALIDHNTGYVFNLAPHEIRKIAYLTLINDHDIEVKSWASEIARAYLDRRFGTELPSHLTPRHYSLFQTRHLSLGMLRWADAMNEQYLAEHDSGYTRMGVSAGDLYYWEGIFSNWGATVVTSQSALPDVTVPMNNRRLLEMLLTFPRESRAMDEPHRRLVDLLNPALSQGVSVVKNISSTARRTQMERIFLCLGLKL